MAALELSGNIEGKITILRPCLKFLQLHFLWPKTSEEISPGIDYTIKAFANIAFPYILVITSVLHSIYVKTNDLDVVTDEDVVACLAVFSLSLVSLEFYFKQSQYARVLLQLSDLKFGRPKDFGRRIEAMLGLLSKVFYYFVAVGIIVYGLIPIIEQSTCEKFYKAKGFKELCGYFIPTPPWIVPDANLVILKPVIIALQIFAAFAAVVPAALNSILVFQMNIHLVVHMKNLKSHFRSLSASSTVKNELYYLVEYHQHIIELMNSINACCSRALCVHTFLTSTVIGSILNQILQLTWQTPVGPLFHLVIWILALLLNSIGGEIILNESTTIASALYCSDWMEFNEALKKDVWLIIFRAQQPLLLTTGAFGYMSLGVFITVIKGIYTLVILPLG